ncbi:RidA family protein [Effusibacillus consociatus]|uniref:RidA family protein n=1 Tax=Effusibacillus consociatus TaxID=1117041 RepID=A0ABV9PZ26_9BACL
MQIISTDKAPQPNLPYSQAVKVGNLVYTSGTLPFRPDGTFVDGTFEEQLHQVFANLEAVLDAAGTSLNKVVKTTVFLKNMDDFAKLNEIYGSYFKEHRPARSTIEVARLPKDALVEIELVAAV